MDMMQRISGKKPKVWNVATIGFGSFHYKYDSGREGDCHNSGFYPRKGKTTIYILDGTKRYAKLLATLGKHTSSGYCIWIKKLSDVDLPILEQIVRQSYDYIESQEGHMHEVLSNR